MGFIRDLTGKTAVDAATKAGEIQNVQAQQSATDVGVAGAQSQALLDPFSAVAQQGIDQAGFLTDPQAQFDFLQNNPLFQASLDNANRVTQQSAASQGRLSAGDTALDLSNNFLLSAQPLIGQQQQSIRGLIDLGRGVASEQGGTIRGTAADVANLQTGGAAAQAAGTVGAANARGTRAGNLLSLGTSALDTIPKIAGLSSLFSDENLKENIKLVGKENGHNVYKWAWNKLASTLGLTGESRGVIAQQVKATNPEAISYKDGFMQVNYEMIGVSHGN